MIHDVHVGVDPAGHHGQPAEVVGGWAARARDALDPAVLNGDADVLDNLAAAVEQLVGLQGGRWRL
jgi:hypothetical protein